MPHFACSRPVILSIVLALSGILLAAPRPAPAAELTAETVVRSIERARKFLGGVQQADGSSFCEWKGHAVYWDVVIGDNVLPRVGWSYPDPTRAFAKLRDHVAFYAAPFDRCSVDGETVTPQPGGFYGGWITSGYSGPFKGVPGSRFW